MADTVVGVADAIVGVADAAVGVAHPVLFSLRLERYYSRELA